PTAEWGRAVLGTVGPATEETLKNAGDLALPTDEVGISGLQYHYQQRLPGEPAVTIDLAEKAQGGTTVDQVYVKRPKHGEPLETTLDLRAQGSAERAVSAAEGAPA